MTFDAYPLQFDPILKNNIWGGNKLATELGKPAAAGNVGESWELSTIPDSISVVSNGRYASKTLLEMLEDYPEEILGKPVYDRFGKQFPLLLKFIDAKQDLSIQVHPNDEIAKKRHNSFGKTEMWYIMQADPKAQLIIGFQGNASAEKYLEHLQNKTLPNILNHIQVRPGDAFFLETGVVHSIGAGILLAEIQQTSDITYRIYDFDRTDDDGKKRELHIDQALDAIRYEASDAKREYGKLPNYSNQIVECPYFTAKFIPLDGDVDFLTNRNSFRVFMCVDGSFTVISNAVSTSYKKGDTVLIPAVMNQFTLSGKASLLEIYIS